MFEEMNRNDFLKKNITWITVSIIFVLALVIYLLSKFSLGASERITALIDGQELGTYSLYEDQEIRIETAQGYNILVIKDGQAFVSEADCDNQVCVHTQPVRETGGQIVCLPHKVVIRLTTTEKSEIDAVTN